MSKLTPSTPLEDFKFLRREPQKYLALAEQEIRNNPNSAHAYSARYHALSYLGRKEEAFADIEKAISLHPHWVNFDRKAILLRDMGRYADAIAAFDQAEKAGPEEWPFTWGPLFRADTYAKMGNEAAALADCARLADDHWSPGVYGTPSGDKQKVAAELRRRAAAAKRQV
jgi:tetratricopeptide (TPR) repeat protein